MVFASGVFTFANTSSDQFCLVSSKHFLNFPLGGIYLLLKDNVLRQVI